MSISEAKGLKQITEILSANILNIFDSQNENNVLNIFDSQNENNVSFLPAQWLIVISI